MGPAGAVSSFENWHFLSHRPPIFIKNMKWKLLEKIVPLQTLFLTSKIAIFCRIAPLLSPHAPPLTMRRPPPLGSAHRGILCVEKIGSVVPELQEWPGTPSKPVKSTNGSFYWLTRKRAPPCGGTLWGDPCWGTPVKTGSRPGSEVGLVLLPGDRFTSFTSHIHTHRKRSYRP